MASTYSHYSPAIAATGVVNRLLEYIKTIITWGTVFETKGNLFGSPVPPVGGLEISEEDSREAVTGTCWGDEEADPEGDCEDGRGGFKLVEDSNSVSRFIICPDIGRRLPADYIITMSLLVDTELLRLLVFGDA